MLATRTGAAAGGILSAGLLVAIPSHRGLPVGGVSHLPLTSHVVSAGSTGWNKI